MRSHLLLFFGVLGCLGHVGLAAEIGVKPEEVLIGQCAALTGPTAGLGIGMRTGLKAAIDEVNAKGGAGGRQIRLISSDDLYDPDKCVECTSKLIEEDHVFALAGYVGTPTAKVAAPIVEETKVPLIGIFSGAMLLREPVLKYVFNVRASYDDETETLVEYLTGKLGLKRIAVFYQNDSFGQAGLDGTGKALKKRSMSLAGKGAFERNTIAVKSGLAAVLDGHPEAVIVVAPYKPAAEFVRQAQAAGLKAQFATISFVGAENLLADLGAAAEGMLISQVVPSPADANVSLSREYRAALSKSAPDATPSYVSFEGYLTGRVLIAALERAGPDLTREKLVESMEKSLSLDFGGMKGTFSASSHQAFRSVFLTRIQSGQITSVSN